MKRIDEKIKEIEKKDKGSRVLYIAFVVLIIAFMAYALNSEKEKKQKDHTISEQGQTIEEQLLDIKKKNDSLQEVVDKLSKSQTPIGFWNQTMAAKNTTSYLNYIMHQGKPEAKDEYRSIALENIKSNDTEGKTVWLFCGRKNDSRIVSDRVFDLIYREDGEITSVDMLPEKGDVVQNTTMNRNTYRNYANGNATGPNNADKAWKKNSKALVLDVKFAGNAVFVQLKF
ncbi:hypothetical protein ACFS5M_11845 [Lacinutrix iliipiscaria]|uniref:Uncharacterized protein n=1 Tax=Lacinutrix iliipiscaria TaxID=1230532 RepID=A0ABW5WSR7_9FLAO